MQGKIISCINQGSLVQVLVKTKNGLGSIPVDHRCFRHIIEAKDNLKGKEVQYDDENKVIFFTEDLRREKDEK